MNVIGQKQCPQQESTCWHREASAGISATLPNQSLRLGSASSGDMVLPASSGSPASSSLLVLGACSLGGSLGPPTETLGSFSLSSSEACPQGWLRLLTASPHLSSHSWRQPLLPLNVPSTLPPPLSQVPHFPFTHLCCLFAGFPPQSICLSLFLFLSLLVPVSDVRLYSVPIPACPSQLSCL